MKLSFVAHGLPEGRGGAVQGMLAKLEQASLTFSGQAEMGVRTLPVTPEQICRAMEVERFGSYHDYLAGQLLVCDAASALAYAAHPKNCVFLVNPYRELAALAAQTGLSQGDLAVRLHQAISYSARITAGELSCLRELGPMHSQYVHYLPLSPCRARTVDAVPGMGVFIEIGSHAVPDLTRLFASLREKQDSLGPIGVHAADTLRRKLEVAPSWRWLDDPAGAEASDAAVHVCCGLGSAEGIGRRFIDSWSLRRPVIQFVGPMLADAELQPGIGEDQQLVDSGNTGLRRHRAEEVIADLINLARDRLYRELLVERAYRQVMESHDHWRRILEAA